MMSVSDLPNVDFPTLLVTATLPGASPETMASAVATPLVVSVHTVVSFDFAVGVVPVHRQLDLKALAAAVGGKKAEKIEDIE